MRTLTCRCSSLIKIDDEDYDSLSKTDWYCNKGYVVKGFGNDQIGMAQILLGIVSGMYIDHINGDGHDAQKSNLRHVTPTQNTYNRNRYSTNTSGYKGVGTRKGRIGFRAYITVAGKMTEIGYFATKEEAALAYNAMAKQYFGEHAKLNEVGRKD